jgi:hypothetical protein
MCCRFKGTIMYADKTTRRFISVAVARSIGVYTVQCTGWLEGEGKPQGANYAEL